MAKPKKRPSLTVNGWTPRIGGWRHDKTGLSVIRAMTLDEGDVTDSEWRVLDQYGLLMAMYPSLTEAMAFAQSTATLQEEP